MRDKDRSLTGLPATPFPERRIGQVSIAEANVDDAIALILLHLELAQPKIYAFCNAHTVNLARSNSQFASDLLAATVFNDGIGVELGSRLIHGRGFPANLNGTDLTPRLLHSLPPQTPVFLLGSPPGIAERAAGEISRCFPNAEIVGVQHGYFHANEEPAIAMRIRQAGARLVLVGMGQPRQERWAAEWTEELGTVVICIGAWLDFIAGAFARAPVWVRRARMEWAYRLWLEPRRLASRYILGNPTFLLAAAAEAASQRRWRTKSADESGG